MTKHTDTALVPLERITHSILVLRGHRVIIDSDLAEIYGVETRALNQAVKRNAERFPEDFHFQLTAEEALLSRSQSVILKSGRGRNVKFLPHAFTEHGAIQAANVLNSRRAVLMGIHVVRAFVQLRALLASNKELEQKFAELERKVSTHDQAISGILKAIRELMNPPEPVKRPIGFVYPQERK
ncbi:MAG TPA: ORF6N domain-containing protein [Povalibacter sp.]|nr:ORF6N domain-containing protein [Povalibacter sp.]